MSKTRRRNKREWPQWEDLPDGRRRYWKRKAGYRWGYQVFWKEVTFDPISALETTVRVWQEIYSDDGRLVEVHHKYPEDTGHRSV